MNKATLDRDAGFVESMEGATLVFQHPDFQQYFTDVLRYGLQTTFNANGRKRDVYAVRTKEQIHAQHVKDLARWEHMTINELPPRDVVWTEVELRDRLTTLLGSTFPTWYEQNRQFLEVTLSQDILNIGWGMFTRKVAVLGFMIRTDPHATKVLTIQASGAFQFVWTQRMFITSIEDIETVLHAFESRTTISVSPGGKGFIRCSANFQELITPLIRVCDNFLVELSRRILLPVSSMFGKPTIAPKSLETAYRDCISNISLLLAPALDQRRLLTPPLDERIYNALHVDLISRTHTFSYGRRILTEAFHRLEDQLIDTYGRSYTHSQHPAIPYLLRILSTIQQMKTDTHCLALERFVKLARNETTRGSNLASIDQKSIVTGPGFYRLADLEGPLLTVARCLFSMPPRAGGKRRRTRRQRTQQS
jgi:hypothetical protein